MIPTFKKAVKDRFFALYHNIKINITNQPNLHHQKLIKLTVFTFVIFFNFTCLNTNAQVNTPVNNPLTQIKSAQKPTFIVLAPHIVENLFAIGAGDQILGTTEHSDYPVEALDIPRIGNYANLQIERILQLNPDYVIAWKTGNPPADIARLEKLGIKIIYSKPTHLSSVADELSYFGEISNNQKQAQTAAKAYLLKLKHLKSQYQAAKPIRVFYQLWSNPLTTISNQAWPLQLLEICQVDNPFDNLIGDYPHISLEQVIVSKPEIIIFPTSKAEPNEASFSWQKYPIIPAVKKRQIITVDSDKLHRMTPRALDELAVMCEKIDSFRSDSSLQNTIK